MSKIFRYHSIPVIEDKPVYSLNIKIIINIGSQLKIGAH